MLPWWQSVKKRVRWKIRERERMFRLSVCWATRNLSGASINLMSLFFRQYRKMWDIASPRGRAVFSGNKKKAHKVLSGIRRAQLSRRYIRRERFIKRRTDRQIALFQCILLQHTEGSSTPCSLFPRPSNCHFDHLDGYHFEVTYTIQCTPQSWREDIIQFSSKHLKSQLNMSP